MFKNYTDGAKAFIIGIMIIFISAIVTLTMVINEYMNTSSNFKIVTINNETQFECEIKVTGSVSSNEDIMIKLKSNNASIDCKL